MKNKAVFLAFFVLTFCQDTVGFTTLSQLPAHNQARSQLGGGAFGEKTNRSSSSRSRSRFYMYLHPTAGATSQTPPMAAQSILSAPHVPAKQKRQHTSSLPLSNSVLASSDTLPSFPTAHGLLSPETVMRMDKNSARQPKCEAVSHFLETYRTEGPMACVPMLSDPRVLPKLTEAMRYIA